MILKKKIMSLFCFFLHFLPLNNHLISLNIHQHSPKIRF
ncbi:unnamed protein product [Brassica rapa subsp. narinosa]|uniref:(rape) hypothetical protein n=1 Tax=Brassica napus TaxID=3708 RepID=A0A816YGD5_BRANA|nr:unnamed protein product [Brassica napus]